MLTLRRASTFATIGLLLGAVIPAAVMPVAAATTSISLSPVASGFQHPTQVTSANDGSGRLFVVEQGGTIRVVQGGVRQPGYFLDIRSWVASGGERGLLGLAFHPDFATNHQFFVYYTRNGGDIVVMRFTAGAPGTPTPKSTAAALMVIEHSAASNHNGGSMAFGPDGLLYIGVGDGGGAGDPGNDAQEKTSTLLGKLLRIDVDGTGNGKYGRYRIPRSNPYAGDAKPGFGEIWAIGLRNPWRISFDRVAGRLYIGDVGQNRFEEIDREIKGYHGGRNYGWSPMEGKHCYKASRCPLAGDTLPVAEYSHSGGNCSITGGYVYRGPTQTALVGQYVFADYCSGRIWTMPATGTTLTQRHGPTGIHITSFGEDEAGELYAVTSTGGLYQVLAS